MEPNNRFHPKSNSKMTTLKIMKMVVKLIIAMTRDSKNCRERRERKMAQQMVLYDQVLRSVRHLFKVKRVVKSKCRIINPRKFHRGPPANGGVRLK